LDETLAIAGKRDVELVALDDALVGISVSTVKRDWIMARTWIFRGLA
jgi:hypothetical protein